MLLDVSRACKDPGQSYPFEATADIEPMTVLDDPVRFTDVRLSGTMTGTGACPQPLRRTSNPAARCVWSP